MDLDIIQMIIAGAPAFLFSLTLHEYAHAWMAAKLGDKTGAWLGRLTLNPIPHIDPIGTIAFPLLLLIFQVPFLFGWAKPVPYNPSRLRQPVRDAMFIALAGPVANLMLMMVFIFVYRVMTFVTPVEALTQGGIVSSFVLMLKIGVYLNMILAVFNMIPIPPLDGSKVLRYFLPYQLQETYQRIEPYGFLILILFMTTDILDFIIDPVRIVVALLMGSF